MFFKLFKPAPHKKIKNLLFLDTDGASLSALAEAFSRKYATVGVTVRRSGLHPQPVHPLTAKVLEEVGLSVDPGPPPGVKDLLNAGVETVITLSASASQGCPIFPGEVHKLFWGVEDPMEAGGSEEDLLAAFRKARDTIEKRVKVYFYQ